MANSFSINTPRSFPEVHYLPIQHEGPDARGAKYVTLDFENETQDKAIRLVSPIHIHQKELIGLERLLSESRSIFNQYLSDTISRGCQCHRQGSDRCLGRAELGFGRVTLELERRLMDVRDDLDIIEDQCSCWMLYFAHGLSDFGMADGGNWSL